MQAVILCAGKGERLKALSSPKALTKLLGLTLIERVIFTLYEVGIREVILITGYKSEEIKSYLDTHLQLKEFRLTYVYNEDWEKGNGTSFLKAQDYVKDDFLLLMCDHIFESSLIEKVKNTPLSDTLSILVVDNNPKGYIDKADATKVVIKEGKIVNLGKNLSQFDGLDCGLFLHSKEVFNFLAPYASQINSLTQAMRIIAKAGKLKPLYCQGKFWIDIDTPLLLKKAEKLLLKSLIKPTDGVISYYLNRPLSLRLTKYLVNTEVSPNFISFLSFLISIGAGFFFSLGVSFSNLVAGLLAQLSSIIDGCDGEVARLKYKTSSWGGWFDAVIDRYAEAGIILGIILGAIKQNVFFSSQVIWVLGYLSLAGSIMNSYTAIKFDAIFKEKRGKFRFGRDIRLFLIMIGGLFNQLLLLLIVLSFITNYVCFSRLYRIWKYKF